MKINVLILTGYGINAEKELKWAFDMAGGVSKIVHVEDLINNKKMLSDYQILAFPGGFSYGDHIASGRVFSNHFKYYLSEEIKKFIESKKLIIGICNGFQIITKMGIVPGIGSDFEQNASLIENDSGHFEDRWVWLKKSDNNSVWLKDIDTLYLPIRHGEGKFITENQDILNKIIENRQIAFQYINPNSKDSDVDYPYNPNGSIMNIAGITNKEGNVFGLMPHPEAFIFDENHPNWTEGRKEKHTGLKIFQNGINYFK